MGPGMGSLDGWYGDYPVHIFSTGKIGSGMGWFERTAVCALCSPCKFACIVLYIQHDLQAGSMSLLPVSVEITYGLERILMAIQVSSPEYSTLWKLW